MSLLAFMCTDRSDSFDPLCDPGDTVLFLMGVLAVVVAVIVALVVAFRRWRARRRTPSGQLPEVGPAGPDQTVRGPV